MGRPRAFDEQEVVDRAIDLFHRRGYYATSTRDLGEELALNPSSLYRTFGDKRALFLRALDDYQERASARYVAAFDGDGPVRELLRAWLEAMVAPDADEPRGCLMINTATELGTDDPEATKRVHAAFESNTEIIATLLSRGVASGELRADLDVRPTADLVFTIIIGLRVRVRADYDPRDLGTAIDRALGTLLS